MDLTLNFEAHIYVSLGKSLFGSESDVALKCVTQKRGQEKLHVNIHTYTQPTEAKSFRQPRCRRSTEITLDIQLQMHPGHNGIMSK